jgi:hypothetical protein
MTRPKETSPETAALYDIFVDNGRYKTAGTFLTAAGTLLQPSGTANIIKVHQYTISAQGSLVYSFNDTKPTGGTIDFGGIVSSNVSGAYAPTIVKPFIPYPGYLCKTTTVGSALCLGTYVTAPTLGTVYFQAVYTDGDIT